ncbi:MAG: hypothetical protein D6820_12885 [Lentisphaerae bacterium]|nr:MAG: hypothetical protein D6820_12885 [Lentisphaerota bacterium]
MFEGKAQVYKIIRGLFITVLIGGALLRFSATAGEAVIILNNGDEVRNPSGKFSVGKNGAIGFRDDTGQVRRLKREDYRLIFTDCPKSVAIVEKYIRLLKFNEALEASKKVPAGYYWLGWGAFMCYLKAEAYLSQKNYAAALQELKDARQYASYERREAFIRVLKKVIAVEQSKGTEPLPQNADEGGFLVRGILLEKKKQDRAAVLEYMKAVMLFPPRDREGTLNLVRLSAQLRLIRLLKRIGEAGLAQGFQQQLVKEY